jgi:hypothetical protein
MLGWAFCNEQYTGYMLKMKLGSVTLSCFSLLVSWVPYWRDRTQNTVTSLKNDSILRLTNRQSWFHPDSRTSPFCSGQHIAVIARANPPECVSHIVRQIAEVIESIVHCAYLGTQDITRLHITGNIFWRSACGCSEVTPKEYRKLYNVPAQSVQFCTLLEVPTRLYGGSRNLNSYTASLQLQ